MSEGMVMLSGRVPQELKELVDTDRRDNQEIIRAALWREFGGERMAELERRIEEKQRRVNIAQSEKNERKREEKRYKEELEALLQKKARMEEKQEKESKQEVIERAVNTLKPSSFLRSVPKEEQIPPVDDEKLQELAQEADMEPEELRKTVIDKVITE